MDSTSSATSLAHVWREDRVDASFDALDAPFGEDFELSIGEPIDLASLTQPAIELSAYDTIVDGPTSGTLRALAAERLGATIAGRYTLLAVIGAGAGGLVYEARDRQDGRPCAIKLLHDRLRTSVEHVQRFLHEARTASRIGHPGIVRVLAAGHDDDGTVYQALELLDGEPLSDVIDRGGLRDGDIVDIGVQLLDALEAAHAHGILHRDVKPENVFLARDPSGALCVKLIDFGIAKSLSFDAPVGPTTLEGIALGTPHYMSPEQCRGERLDPRTDVWSAGAVLFHAFTGDPPYADRSQGDEPHRVLMRVAQEAPPSLAELRPDLPPAIVAVVDRALAIDLRARWVSSSAMSVALLASGEV